MGFVAMFHNELNPELMLAITPTICCDGVLFAPLFGQAKSSKESFNYLANQCIASAFYMFFCLDAKETIPIAMRDKDNPIARPAIPPLGRNVSNISSVFSII